MEDDRHIRYTDALETVLRDFPRKSAYSEGDIERYILAFSFYLSTGDDGYRYHTSFLEQKQSNFRDFLKRAGEKRARLDGFVKKLTQRKKIKQWRSSAPAQAGDVRISIDDFLERGLSENAHLCEEPSIEGAERRKNIITVHFCKRTASFVCPVSDKDMERAVKIFLSLVTDRSEKGEERDEPEGPAAQ